MALAVIRFVLQSAVPGVCVVAVALVALGLGALGCGDAEVDGPLPLVTITECDEMGGAPLFDPEDERPVELSCPDGLEAVAEFDEDFYGSQGGVCCTSPEAASTDEEPYYPRGPIERFKGE